MIKTSEIGLRIKASYSYYYEVWFNRELVLLSLLPYCLLCPESIVLCWCTAEGVPVMLEPFEGNILLDIRQTLVLTHQQRLMLEGKLSGRKYTIVQ